MENPIKGSYDLVWKELRDHQKDLGKMDSISLQNTIRRIIDTYFVTFGGKARKNLIPENFSEDSDELTIARSFDRWFNEGSHDIMDDFYVEHPRELNEKYIELFKRLFERAGHGAHYEMMMREES
jgi:wobble nucleotide-excising tRNase